MNGSESTLPDALRVPHPERLDPARPDYSRILAAHAAAIADGQAAYVDLSSGLRVFTAQYLWDRGSCCDSGCRHCPYLPRR